MFGGLPWMCIWPSVQTEHEHMESSDNANDELPMKTKQRQNRGFNKNASQQQNHRGVKQYDNETDDTFKQLTERIDALDKICENLTRQNDMLWSQSAEVFRKGRPSRLENVADPFPILTLVHDFKHIYTADWCDIWEEGDDDCATIAELSRLMEDVNKECTSRANHQIKSFLGLDEEDKPPTRKQHPDVYHLRRMENISQEKRTKFTKKLVTPFVEKGFEKEIFNSTTEECKLKENVITFFENFADICWQLAIAEDDIIVDFDVVEKPYDDVKTFFNKYCPSARVLGDKSNTVKTLVWPCVRRTEGEIMEKGEVIVVDPCQTDF